MMVLKYGPSEANDREELVKALSENNLKFGFLVGGSDKNVDKHFGQFRENLEASVLLKPVYTRQPLSNQWEINTFMLEMLCKRYS